MVEPGGNRLETGAAAGAAASIGVHLAESIMPRRRAPTTGVALARFVRRKPLGAASALVVVIFIVVAAAAPLIAPYGPLESVAMRLQSPTLKNLAGTDDLGRDVLSRLIYGARVSLWVGILAVAIGTVSGSVLGVVSGYFGRKTDLIIQRIADGVMAFPGLVFLLLIVAVTGGGSITMTMLAIGFLIWPSTNRVVRSATLAVKENVYIEAARSVGASSPRILVRHIIPNVAAPIIIVASVAVGNAILMEAALGFLGLGVRPPRASWGAMLSGNGRMFMEVAPWLAVAPGVAITITVFAFNMLGDALRDVLDPRLRGT